MTDWAKIAAARGLALSEQEMKRVSGSLTSLEQDFRPLTQQLTPEMEPDVELHLGNEPGSDRE